MGTSGSVSSTSVPGTSTQMRRPTARGAASDRGPLCGGPDGLPRGSTVSQVAGYSGVRGNLIRSQSAMCEHLHAASIGRETALDGVNEVAGIFHVKKTVQVEFRTANSNQAGQAEVLRARAEPLVAGQLQVVGLEILGLVGSQFRKAPGSRFAIFRKSRPPVAHEGRLGSEGIQDLRRGRADVECRRGL